LTSDGAIIMIKVKMLFYC